MRIGSVDTSQRVVVVAEIGNNHEGDPAVAREMVERAAQAGADAVKLQTFRTEHFVSASDAERFARLKCFELAPEVVVELAELARSCGIGFLSTPLDLGSADLLAPLVDAFKIASGDNTFYPLIERVARHGLPVIVATGLAEVDELDRTVALLRDAWRAAGRSPELALLHCVAAYPVAPAEANLGAIPVLAARHGCIPGYSDHTLGIEAAVLSVALGARIIEKHFTLDRAFSDFRDHQLSADPRELAELVRRVRGAEELVGCGDKVVQASEAGGRVAFRRSVVAAADLPTGHVLTAGDLTWVRPGGGIAPGDEAALIGRTLARALVKGDRLDPRDVA